MNAPLELEAPAKLNLFLEVAGQRPDGYHEIDSVLAEIDLCDTVRLEPAERIELTVEGRPAPPGPGNLAWRAAEALGVGARIHLVKRIPSGTGLGGASSDAAAVLRGLDRLYRLDLGREELARRAVALGADVPYFLTGKTARCRGIGDIVEALGGGPAKTFILLVPRLRLSTARVYSEWRPGLTQTPEIATVFVQSYLGGEGLGRPAYFNRLQDVAERVEPRLCRVRRAGEARFGVPFTLTGSGSAYFGEIGATTRLPATLETADGASVEVIEVQTR